ncbi:hypothetical protein [Paenibacillus sp. L3-i20]|uniref:hypothetical protein n=1 Tax=Paenibacillus sp. L3-i20 TaxID=2905833 RepID=UPI001EDE4476|nr:hypothetical protein [Paenibacillus sp. L3-i20]GKU78490.1 hypothetical protein L3i20_v228870 [Paenibacillus sp. L3-i20]
MKKTFVISIILLMLASQSGCSNSKNTDTIDNISGNTEENKITFESEQNDMINAMESNNFSAQLPSDYGFISTIDLTKDSDADRIMYEIYIEKATHTMNDILMTFHLDPKMLHKLDTSNVFQTNIHTEEKINLGPGSKMNGVKLSRELILDTKKIDREMLKIYKAMYVKISYSNGETRVSDYFKVEAVSSTKIEEYLDKLVIDK